MHSLYTNCHCEQILIILYCSWCTLTHCLFRCSSGTDSKKSINQNQSIKQDLSHISVCTVYVAAPVITVFS